MPYKIKKSKDGFKVCKKDDSSECFSKKPLTKKKAKKQMAALYLNENGKLSFLEYYNAKKT